MFDKALNTPLTAPNLSCAAALSRRFFSGWLNCETWFQNSVNLFQDGPFQGCLRKMGGGQGKKAYLPKICQTSYKDENWHSYNLPKEDPKIHESRDTPLSSADIIFSPEISKFCYIKKYKYRLHFDILFLILLTFWGVLKDV